MLYKANDLIQLLQSQKSILVIGPSFTGKTQSLWTLVDWLRKNNRGPLHLHDLDRKCASLIAKCQEVDKTLLDHIIIHRLVAQDKVESGAAKVGQNRNLWLEFQQDLNSYHDHLDMTTGQFKPDFPCGAIFIDSLSKYNEIVLEYVASIEGHDIGAKGTDARNDYQKAINKIKQTIDSVKSIPCITGWIAHDMIIRSEFDGKIVLLPSVSGQNTLAPALSKEFNIVLFSLTEPGANNKQEFKWQIKPGGWVRSAGIVAGKSDLPDFIPQDYRTIL